MGYLWFDLVALLVPVLVLLRGAPRRRRLLLPVAALAGLALAWTAPWDEHLVRSGVWSYDPGQVLGRIGAIPVEEYAFILLEVLLVAAWGARTGLLSPPAADPLGPAGARLRGALGWTAVGVVGVVLAVAGGHARYLGLLLLWTAPPLALQHAVAGDVLLRRRRTRLLLAAPVALWLCAADRVALGLGLWQISPASATGLHLLGLPLEEAVFFGLTALLVGDGLLLALDSAVVGRLRGRFAAGVRAVPATSRPCSSRSALTVSVPARRPAASPRSRARTVR